MSFGRIFRALLLNTRPALYYTAGKIIVKCAEARTTTLPDEKIEWETLDLSQFTHESVIKQSTVQIVNSVSQSLTVTYTAIENSCKEYRKSLALLINLTRDTLLYSVTDSHWDLIIAARSEVEKCKRSVNQLVNYMDYVQKLATAATEASYMAGMDNLSVSLGQRTDDALNNMNREIKLNELLEMEYNDVQEECIRKTGNSDEQRGEEVKVETIL